VKICRRPDAPVADAVTAEKPGTRLGAGQGRLPLGQSVPLSGRSSLPLPALSVTHPAPHTATVSALRFRAPRNGADKISLKILQLSRHKTKGIWYC